MISTFFSNQQDLLQAWIWAMLHSVWIGLILAFLFYTFLGLKPDVSSKVKYRAGMVLMALLPVCVFIAFIYSIPDPKPIQLAIASASGSGSTASSGAATSAVVAQPYFFSWMNQIEQHVQLLFLIWSTGVLLFSMRMAMGYRQINRLRAQTQNIEIPAVIRQFQTLLTRSGLGKKIALVSSARVEIPITLGHFKPMILLPVGLINRLSPEETQAILAHEIAHILRKDYLQNLMISCLEILFFFHPSVWWFSATIKAIREQCCDDIALELGAERIALSKALIQLEESNPGPSFALAFAHKNQLLNRIQRLFQSPHQQLRNEYGLGRSQAPLLIIGIALIWLMANPVVSMTVPGAMMRLSKSFIWDRTAIPADTTKPKAKIEKISRDNGKQKIEMSLEDKKIKELKVDEKIIPPAEYEKYKIETESLKQELAEIEMPKRRTRVYSDFDFDPGVYKFRFNDSSSTSPRVYSIHPKGLFKFGDGMEFRYGEGGKAQNFYFYDRDTPRGSHQDDTKWIIEGDSSGMTIDGEKLIIKNEKGDIIIDLSKGGKGIGRTYSLRRPGDFQGLFPEGQFYRHGPIDLDLKLKIENEIRNKTKKSLDSERRLLNDFEWKQGELMEKMKTYDLIEKRMMEALKSKPRHSMEYFNSDEPFYRGELFKTGHRNNLQETIERKLVDDELIGENRKYEFKITATELRINGKKQNEKIFNEFKSLVGEHTGIDFNEGTTISFSGTIEKTERD